MKYVGIWRDCWLEKTEIMQYKAAMARMLGRGGDSVKNAPDIESSVPSMNHLPPLQQRIPLWAEYCLEHVDVALNCLVPLGWSFLFVLIMDRQLVYNTLYMPFLGIFAACLANTVPIGGGIVYVPALYMLGVDMKLGVSFTVATMSFGNGVFGFLNWLKKDPFIFIWESFVCTVLPSSIGSIIGILLIPPPSQESVRLLFGVFCIAVAIFVARTAYVGGFDHTPPPTTSPSPPQSTLSATPVSISTTRQSWMILALVSFVAGGVLVPHIGIGPALTTYIGLHLMGYPTKAAAITGIVTGGWVSIVPFLIHMFILRDVPYAMWLMVIPGIFVGAKVGLSASTVCGIDYTNACSDYYHIYVV